MAMPSNTLWMESARTMTKLRIDDKIFFSLAAALNFGFFPAAGGAIAVVDREVVATPFSTLLAGSSKSEEYEM
jgi:hypothetical protein